MDMTELAHVSGVERPAAPATARAGGEFLTFRLGAEEYAVDILQVQEIRSFEQPTRIANAPPCVKGVTNLRGTIVPVVDLRLKFGLAEVRYDQFTVVVVLNVGGVVLGAVVDSVSDVCELKAEEIRPAPSFSGMRDRELFTGLGSLADRMLILMDLEALLRDPELGLLAQDAPPH